MDKFLGRHKLQKMIKEKTDYLSEYNKCRDWISNQKPTQKEKPKPR